MDLQEYRSQKARKDWEEEQRWQLEKEQEDENTQENSN